MNSKGTFEGFLAKVEQWLRDTDPEEGSTMLGIKQISNEEAMRLWDNEGNKKYEPEGLFYLKAENKYIGIDNLSGNAWTEEFSNLKACMIWLQGEMTPEEAEEQAKDRGWWIRSPKLPPFITINNEEEIPWEE